MLKHSASGFIATQVLRTCNGSAWGQTRRGLTIGVKNPAETGRKIKHLV